MHLVVNRVTRRLLGSIRSTVDDMMDTIGLPLLGIVPEDQAVPCPLRMDRPWCSTAARARPWPACILPGGFWAWRPP